MRNVVVCLLAVALCYDVCAQDAEPSAPRHEISISAPRPEYPFEARSHWIEGRGLFSLTVRPDGSVAAVEVAKSTGHRILDDSTVAAFQKWRFKPGAVTHVKIPMEFTMAGLRPQGIDSSLQAEKRGSQPPPGYASWPDYWSECERLWSGYHHSDYADYFHRRRKALGLEEIKT
jgi:TonB family protein